MTLIAIALTFGSGAMDVASFTRLGDVFASVMTGNIVLCGLAAARGSVSLIAHTAMAFGGYVVGVAGGTRIAWYHSARAEASAPKASPPKASPPKASAPKASAPNPSKQNAPEQVASGPHEPNPDAPKPDALKPDALKPEAERASAARAAASANRVGAWAPHVRASLLTELALLIGFVVGWEVTGSNPSGGAQFGLLAVATAAMGVQASAVTQMGLTDVSTTYLTGTLTGLVGSLASPGRRKREGLIRPGVLAGLAAGALLSGLLLKTAPAGVPALPVAALITVVLLTTAPPPG